MFLRYGNARDYYSLCGFMNLTPLNLCETVRALRLSNSDSLNRHKRARARVSERVCIFLKLEQSRTSISGRECAATVDGASERANYSCVICFSSRLKSPNQPTLAVTVEKKQHLKISSGLANKHKHTMNKCPKIYISQDK